MGEKIDNLIKLGACISSLVNNGEDIKVIELPHDEQQPISPIKKMDGLDVVVPPPIVPGVVLPYTALEASPLIDLTGELSRKGKRNNKKKVVSKRKRNMVKQSKRKNRKR